MLSKFSVKKPMTVFVAVVLVIVLGAVAFMRMTPDLLPNLDLPYAMIMTPYVGQTPEVVETEVTKPLEQSMATVDGVKRITSQSAENYSVLIIEFEDGTDMDTATVNMRTSLDMTSDAWSERIGTPYMLKINPNMLPVAMTAVDREGMDRLELSSFIGSEIMPKLEGVDGVASVSDKGLLTEQENIVLSQDKIDKLNKKISAALDNRFADAEEKLTSAKAELESNISAAKDGTAVISSSLDEIDSQQAELGEQLAQAQTQADDGKTKLLSAKMELLDQKASLAQTKQTLELTYNALISIKTGYDDLIAQRGELTEMLGQLEKAREQIRPLLDELESPDITPERREELLAQIDQVLSPLGVTAETLGPSIIAAQTALDQIDSSIGELTERMEALGTDIASIDEALKSISDQIAQINTGTEQLDAALRGLDEQTLSVSQALATISQQQSSADFKMSSAVAALTAKQTEATAAAAQLEAAQNELNENLDALGDKKKEASDAADMSGKVTLDNVSAILTAQSFSMPAGYVTDDNNNRFMVRVGDEVRNEEELSELALFDTGIDGIGTVRLNDVADVFVSDNSGELYTKINGNDGVILSFRKQSDIATSVVCDNLNERMRSLSEENEGLSFTNLYSQGDYIAIIINSVLQNLLMGAGLAIILLFIFLRDVKPTLIVACSIPVSVVFAIVLMYFSGVTLNMISLSGLAIGVGMLVDNSVVVIENIYRLRAKGHSAPAAAVSGAKQVAGAIAASTLTTICVFLPIVFVEGITRQIFQDMALTIGYSLVASLIVALTLVPAMSQSLLRRVRETKSAGGGRILGFYDRSLRFVLRHKLVSLLVVTGLLVGSGVGTFARGFSFMPSMGSTEVQVTVTMDPNSTFDETVAEAEKLNEVMMKYDEFETVGVSVGSVMGMMGLSMGGSSADSGSIMAYGVLKPDKTKQGAEISKQLEEELTSINGEVTIGDSSTGSMSTLIGDSNVQIDLSGEELGDLQTTAKDIAEKLEALDSVSSADNGMGATSPEIKVTVDRLKAAEKKLTVAQVFQQVAAAVAEEKTSATLRFEGGKSIDVVIAKDDSALIDADSVGSIDLTYQDSEGKEHHTSLSSVADIDRAETMDIIRHTDQKRTLTITGEVADGYSLTAATNDAKKLLEDYDLPAGCSISFEGSDKATMEAMQQLGLMMLLGVVMIYLIMVAQFQSLKSPFIIMFTIPLAFTGGFLGLLLTGFDISVVSMLGFIMLCGIIVNNGIVLVDYINVLRLEGKERVEAIAEAGKTRMRPIFITALTTVLGLSVMALGIGTGAEMMQPLAIVCIGGLLYATLMTLYIIPLIYDSFNKKELRQLTDKELEIEE